MRYRDKYWFDDRAHCIDVWTMRRGVKVMVAEIVIYRSGVWSVNGKSFKTQRAAENAAMEG